MNKSELYHIDRLDKLPLYEQIERNLRELILSGALQPGDGIPPEFELAERYGVSRLTVRRAIDDLARQEWLARRHGVGTFVTRPARTVIAPSRLSFTQEMLAVGRRPSSRLIFCRSAPAPAQAATALALPEGFPVVELQRVRLADGQPILLETAYLSAERFPGLEDGVGLENGSLYGRLAEQYGVEVARVDQTLRAILLDETQAELLGARAGAPAILCMHTGYTADGEVVEVAWSVSHGENSEFYFSFRRGEVTAEGFHHPISEEKK